MSNISVRFISSLILASALGFAGQSPMFPPGTFSHNADWDRFTANQTSGCLRSFGENSIWQLSQRDPLGTVYRLLWLRSFKPAVCIRLNIAPDGSGILATKILNGCCDCPPPPKGYLRKPLRLRTTTKTISIGKVRKFLANVDAIHFWNLPSHREIIDGPDGTSWIIEGSQTGRYQLIDDWEPPRTAPANILGRAFLVDLAGFKLAPDE